MRVLWLEFCLSRVSVFRNLSTDFKKMWKYCSFFFKKKIPTTTKFICYPNKSAIQSDWITCHAIDNYKIFPNDIVYELIILAVNLQNTEHICQISIKSIELWFKEYCICWIVTVYEWVCKICVEIFFSWLSFPFDLELLLCFTPLDIFMTIDMLQMFTFGVIFFISFENFVETK